MPQPSDGSFMNRRILDSVVAMKLLISLLALVAATGAVAAAEFMVCPPWEIMVVDEVGKPMAGCAVVQEWGSDFQNVYVTGTTNAVTDAEGRVRFPSRHIGPPPGESGWRKLGRAIDRRPEGSPAAMAIVSKPGY